MPYQNLEPVSKQLTIVVGLTVVGFMTFGLTLSFYRNVLFERTLQHIALQNEKLRQQIGISQGDLEYFRSAQYKDKHAKENFGRLKPGEKLLIITQEPKPFIGEAEGLADAERRQEAYEEYLRQMPIPDHWRLYFLGKEQLEELRKRL